MTGLRQLSPEELQANEVNWPQGWALEPEEPAQQAGSRRQQQKPAPSDAEQDAEDQRQK